MSKTTRHPKRHKVCAFCTYWIGNVDFVFRGTMGYEFESDTPGQCAKKGTGVNTRAVQPPCCSPMSYTPNEAARKLM